MRLLGTVNDTLRLSQEVIRNFNKITSNITDDYKVLSKHILTLTSSIARVGTDVINPIIGLFGFLDRFRSNTKNEED